MRTKDEEEEDIFKIFQFFDPDPSIIESAKKEIEQSELEGRPIVPSEYYEKYLTPLAKEFFQQREPFWSCDYNQKTIGYLNLAFQGLISLNNILELWNKTNLDQQVICSHYGDYLLFATESGNLAGIKILHETFTKFVRKFPDRNYEVIFEIKKALLLPCRHTEIVAYLLDMMLEFSKDLSRLRRNFWLRQLNVGRSEVHVGKGDTPFLKFFADLYLRHTIYCGIQKVDSQHPSNNNIDAMHRFLKKNLTTGEQFQQLINEILRRLTQDNPFAGISNINEEIETRSATQLIAARCCISLRHLWQEVLPAEGISYRKEKEEKEKSLFCKLKNEIDTNFGLESGYKNRFFGRDPHRDSLIEQMQALFKSDYHIEEILDRLDEIGDQAQAHHVEISGARFFGTLVNKVCQFKEIIEQIVEKYRQELYGDDPDLSDEMRQVTL
jgi:hypothetical protein